MTDRQGVKVTDTFTDPLVGMVPIRGAEFKKRMVRYQRQSVFKRDRDTAGQRKRHGLSMLQRLIDQTPLQKETYLYLHMNRCHTN